MTRDFQGRIELDVRDSEGDWEAFLPSRASEGAPNVVVFDIADDAYVDVQSHLAAAMARD